MVAAWCRSAWGPACRPRGWRSIAPCAARSRFSAAYGARTRQDLPAVVDLADKGVINYRDVVSRRLPLEEAGAGYTALRNREIQGRAVVDMSL